jgi:hypothetical protein
MTPSVARHIVSAIAVLLLAVASPALAQLQEIGTNLVANPSFEENKEGSLPLGWSGDRQVYSVDTSVTRSGKAALKYVNNDASRYRLVSRVVPVQPGWKVRMRVWVKTENLKGEESGATTCMEWSGKDGKWLGGCYPSGVKGTSDWKLVEGVTRVPENATSVRLSCYARKGMTGTAWFDDVELVRVADPPMQVTLLSPGYRGRLTKAGPDELRFRVRLNLTDYDLKPQSVRIASQLSSDADKRVYWQATASTDQGVLDQSASVKTLPVGQYTLAVSLVKPDGTVWQTSRQAIVRVPDDFQPQCTIDPQRRLLVDGKPFFPIGMYWSGINEKDMALYAQSKFNCLMPYGSPKKDQMDLAQKHGLKVIYSVKDWYLGTTHCPKDIKTAADEERRIRTRVQEFRDHPALLAWYLNDELPESFMPQLEAHQRWVSEEDPNHPSWVVLYQFREVGAYLKSFDVIGTDPYPIGRKPASVAAEWTAETFRQVEGTRAVWQVPQVFNWGNYAHTPDEKSKGRTPTFDEMRSMTWQCIAEGATGLVFYSWFDIKRNPDVPFDTQWEHLKRIAAEVDQMAPALLSVDPVAAVKTETAAGQRPTWLHPLVKSHNGKLYLIAANDGDGEGPIRFTFPSAPRSIRELSEGRTISATGTSFQDQSAKLSVKIYEIEVAR